MIYILIHIFYVLLFCVTTVQSAVAISLRILLWRNSLIAIIFFFWYMAVTVIGTTTLIPFLTFLQLPAFKTQNVCCSAVKSL